MKFELPKGRKWVMWVIAIVMACLPGLALAHERFIAHTPKMPIYEAFFTYLNYNMLNVATRVALIMGAMMTGWFMREPIYDFIMTKIMKKMPSPVKDLFQFGAQFAMDKPIKHPWFTTLNQWIVILFLRCPALVLMFAAANKSLVMTSYPLEPSTTAFFQFAQVLMALGILTQSFLPFGGATIIGTFVYLCLDYDWKIAVDVLPVLTVAVIYVGAPWDSWKRAITNINLLQMRWVRLVLGFGFFALGWMKLYNYYLTVGVADNFKDVLNDPMILMFYAGTAKSMVRECWIVAFGMAEVMTGFLLMVGIFSRVWCLMMVYLFSKLMIVNFGWAEIPHLYPIGAFLVVMFSNNLTNEFSKVDDMATKVAKSKKGYIKHALISGVIGFTLSFLAVYPALFLLTKTHPKAMPKFERSAEWHPSATGPGGTLRVYVGPLPMVAGENVKLEGTLTAKIRTSNDQKEIDIVPTNISNVSLKTGEEQPIISKELKNADDLSGLTMELFREDDKERTNPYVVGINVEAVRGFKYPSAIGSDVTWNNTGTAGVFTAKIQPLPQLGGEETKLNAEFKAAITHKTGITETRVLKNEQIFSSNAPTMVTYTLEGVLPGDDISIDGRFSRTDDTKGNLAKHVLLLDIRRPVEEKKMEKKDGMKM